VAADAFTECVTPVGEGTRELFVVEGISASNAAVIARDPKTQAILAVQGGCVPLERSPKVSRRAEPVPPKSRRSRWRLRLQQLGDTEGDV